MNAELPQHPTIFVFMNTLRCTVYQQGISIVAQNSSGRTQASKATIAARKLTEKSKEVEESYLQGLITPTEVLQQAATHYEDNQILDTFLSASQQIEDQILLDNVHDEELTPSRFYFTTEN